jgi:hypothetical protein
MQNVHSIGCDAIKKIALEREKTVIYMVRYSYALGRFLHGLNNYKDTKT